MRTDILNLKIIGMHCENCEKAITKALNQLEGVIKATVSFSKRKGSIEYNPAKTKEQSIEQEITKLGYQIKKSVIQRWLQRMAESNQKQFGTGRKDCCTINKK